MKINNDPAAIKNRYLLDDIEFGHVHNICNIIVSIFVAKRRHVGLQRSGGLVA